MSNLQQVAKVLKEELGFSPGQVELFSAKPIDEEIFHEILEVFGKETLIKQTVDPRLVGGLKIKVGDLMLDVSIETELDQLGEKIRTGASEAGNLSSQMMELIDQFKATTTVKESGSVISIKDGVCKIEGLTHCMYQEVLEFIDGTRALALNLEKESVGAVIFGDYSKVREGDLVTRTGKVMSVLASEKLLGHVIDPLGNPLDGSEPITDGVECPVEKIASGVIDRELVTQPLSTGIKAIDALIPIGRGQRELILGDRQTGKTSIAIDTIINQKSSDVISIYVAIGQKESKVSQTVELLSRTGALERTIVIDASASMPAAMLYLAPYSGVAIAEYFAAQGKDVLIVYDDLTKHAIAYRELSLLLRRPPGREAFPGDVFYLHSRLLERACKLNDKLGGGSITALPIIETQAGDISAFVPTNVISITDGQIFLESDLFYRGIRPAINVGLSVSRVGSSAQTKPMKKVAGKLKLSLAQFRELEAFSQFSSDLDAQTKELIERGKRLTQILKQRVNEPVPTVDQIIAIFAVSNGLMDSVPVEKLSEHEPLLVEHVKTKDPTLIKKLEDGEWDEEIEAELRKECEEYILSIQPDAAEQ